MKLLFMASSAASLSASIPVARVAATWAAESSALATLACEAAQRARGDCGGGLVWLEHVNIVVGERALAERFYFEEGLGCARDPSKPGGLGQPTGTMWANLGSQQFHLAEEAADDLPQAVRGSIGLALPDARAAKARLQKLAAACPAVVVESHCDERFSVRCPWGNVFHCYDCAEFRASPLTDEEGAATTASAAAAVTAEAVPKMAAMHEGAAHDLGGRVAVRGGPGIRYAHFRCGDASGVAAAYARHLSAGGAAPVSVPVSQETAGGLSAAHAVSAGVGPVHLIFEHAPPDAAADAKQRGVHLCVYVDQFADRYAALKPTVFTNERFRHLDTCDTLDQALASRTFRFTLPDLPDLEFETRALSHKSFMKPVFYTPT